MKKAVWIIIAIIVLIVAWYLASPLFINKTVNEEFPVQGSQDSMNQEEMEEIMEATYQGDFIDADSFHEASGQALIIQDQESNYLRLENFKTTNGPDLYVYLANDLEAEDFISLGRLKGNQGDQNYEIPEDINPEDYQYVLIWCRAFSTLFGSAELQ